MHGFHITVCPVMDVCFNAEVWANTVPFKRNYIIVSRRGQSHDPSAYIEGFHQGSYWCITGSCGYYEGEGRGKLNLAPGAIFDDLSLSPKSDTVIITTKRKANMQGFYWIMEAVITVVLFH